MKNLVAGLLSRLWPSPPVGRPGAEGPIRPVFPGRDIRSWTEYERYAATMATEYARRRQIEYDLLPASGDAFEVDGVCAVCNGPRAFRVTFLYAYELTPDGRSVPNWREHLVCRCGFGNRVRAAIHYLLNTSPRTDATFYITEQTTPLYAWLKAGFPRTTGSEYMGADATPGSLVRGFRHEDLLRLSFASDTFDYVLSFDVLEHVGDSAASFRECLRVLKPGGTMIFTAPFTMNLEADTIRAVLKPDGSVEHLMPPEYHGNPIDPDGGSLCFRYFGWRMLDDLRGIGFADPRAVLYWSRELGYLGGEQVLFVASKPAGRPLA